MLEHYFKYPGVLRRMRLGPLGVEIDAMASDLERAGYTRLSARRYLSLTARFSRYAMRSGCVRIHTIDRALVERFLRQRSLAGIAGIWVTPPRTYRGDPPEHLGEVHFGVALADEEAVGSRRAELAAMGIPEVDWWVEPGFVSLKVADPDGYVVEFFWERAGEPM